MTVSLTNLPVPVSRFLGREQACDEVAEAVSRRRLVTLTGAGGSGKTRLAIEVGSRLADHFPDGVWLVDLAPVNDARLVPVVTGQTLKILQHNWRRARVNELARALHDRNLLLLLDNCEHLIEACAALAHAVLQVCPHVHVLATSREPLHIEGESIWPVAPLRYPDPRAPAEVEDLQRYESVALFVDRAVSLRPDFKLTEANAQAVATVCARLDGMPLALELAAARLRSLTVEQIAERLDDRFDLLTRGSRIAPGRHQTLRAALEWSHDLLTSDERILFRRLAIFGGGWTLDAAEAVCSDAVLTKQAVLDTLDQLVSRSLVVAEERQGAERFRMLETIRQFAMEQLDHSDEKLALRRRHRSWVLSVLERTPPEAYDVTSLALLDQEQDNLRNALSSAVEDSDANAALRLSSNWLFWYMRGLYSEGLAWLDDALALSDPASDRALRARALCSRAYLHYLQGDLADAEVSLEDALQTADELRDDSIRAVALHQLGNVAKLRGDLNRAAELLEEALATSRRTGNRNWQSMHLVVLSEVLLEAGDFNRSQEIAGLCLSVANDVGHTWSTARALHFLGRLAARRNDTRTAAELLENSVRLQRALGNRQGLARTLRAMAQVASVRGDQAAAGQYLGEALRLSRESGERAEVASCLSAIAVLVAATDAGRARSIADAADRVWAALGAQPFPEDRTRLNEVLSRGGGGPAGSAPVESTIRLALELADAYADAAQHAEGSAAPVELEQHPLTPREREVAELIARGCSNREIARILVVSEGTAGNHVQHVLDKLGFHTRAQVASWATARGLGSTR